MKSHSQPAVDMSSVGLSLAGGDNANGESGSGSAVESSTGVEAPPAVAGVEEGEDDVEFPEAVVLVGKTHWRCVTCMVLHPRTVSIDHHLNTHHKQPDLPALTPSAPKPNKRGRGRVQGAMQGKVTTQPPANPEVEAKLLRSSLRPGQETERGRSGRGRWTSLRGNPQQQRGRGRGRGRGLRGSRGSRGGRGRGVRGRGRVFTKPLTSDDSDTDIEAPVSTPPASTVSLKRKAKTPAGLDAGEPTEPVDRMELTEEPTEPADRMEPTCEPTEPAERMEPPGEPTEPVERMEPTGEPTEPAERMETAGGRTEPSDRMEHAGDVPEIQTKGEADVHVSSHSPSKKAKTGEEDVVTVHETPISSPHLSPEAAPMVTVKDLMKEKYVVFVGKAGTSDCLSESVVLMDNEAPLPIEIPSLQADALLPPATPLLPDIHGPPETPIPPDTPHLPEFHHQPYPFHPPESSDVDCRYPSQGVPPVAQGVVSGIASEHLSKPDDGADTGVAGGAVTAEGTMLSGPDDCDKEQALSLACRTCGAAFECLDELTTHREEMVKFDVVSCNSCGDKFHGLHQLNIHVFAMHEKFASRFCFLCDADCLDGYELEEHLLEHTSAETDREDDGDGVDSIQHTCKTCGTQVEGSVSDLVNHYHTTHDQLICAKCHELFIDHTEYELHKLQHSSAADAQGDAVVFSCPVSDCFQMCADREALMDHISWHEDRDMEEELHSLLHCPYCHAPFRNVGSLQRHQAETHNEVDLRPFVCELCSAAFSHSLELHRHNAIHHAGIKRYGCAYCHQRFAFRSAHRRHVASEHDVAATVLRM